VPSAGARALTLCATGSSAVDDRGAAESIQALRLDPARPLGEHDDEDSLKALDDPLAADDERRAQVANPGTDLAQQLVFEKAAASAVAGPMRALWIVALDEPGEEIRSAYDVGPVLCVLKRPIPSDAPRPRIECAALADMQVSGERDKELLLSGAFAALMSERRSAPECVNYLLYQ
jgi:hypothetical protein